MKICCIGISIQDRIFTIDTLPHKDGKYFASSFKEQGGGPAATAAVACARLGCEVDMIARVGDDPTGNAIIAELKDEGVGIDKMCIVKGATSTQAAIFVDKEGSRIIVSYPSPSLIYDVNELEKIDFSQYDVVLADVRWHEAALKAFDLAQKACIPTILDADVTTQNIEDLVALSTHAIFSKPGLALFSGTDDVNKGLEFAKTKTNGSVYVTLGSDGYSYLNCDKIVKNKGFKVNVIDTTGAGDVFHGAFAVALANKFDTEKSLKFSAATAALKCTKPGGRSGIPTFTEVMDFIIKY